MSNLNTTTLNNTAIVNNINKDSKFLKTKSKLMFYLQSSSKGVLVGITAFFICHPLEVIKTRKQASFSNTNFEVIKETYNKGGFRSFYSGCVPNLIRYSIRNAYRWPLMLYLPAYFSKYYDHMKAKLISAVSLANIECFIITPLERLKVYIMVNSYNNSPSSNNTDTNSKYDAKHPIKKVLYNKDYWKINEIYKGIAPLILRQNISWLSFLGSDHYLKMLFTKRKLAKNSENTKLSFKELNMVSFLVAIINTFFVIPFDFIKTSYQKNMFVKSIGLLQFIKETHKEKGVLAFYSGFQMRFFYYIIQSVFFVNLLYKLENENKNKFY